jgi:diguanylate cyclase (GGDEF)-like protein/PAS domain S-box-containing protein
MGEESLIKIFFLLISTLLFATTQEPLSTSLQFSKFYAEKEKNFSKEVGVDIDAILDKYNGAFENKNKNIIHSNVNNILSIEYIKEQDFTLLKRIVVAFTFVLLIVFFIYKRERGLKKDLELKNIVFDTIIDTIENPMFYKNKEGVYKNVNDSFARDILGIKKVEVEGKTLDELSFCLSPKEIAFFKEQDKKLYENGINQVYETKLKVKDGSVKCFRIQKNLFYSASDELLGYVGFMYDITDIKKREEELEYIASTDPLTQLYNRRYFGEVGESILNISKREKKPLSLIMLDIDFFKRVNDTYGHKIGDDVIVSIAHAMNSIGRKSDIACRFGGEEFLLLLPNTTIEGAYSMAQKLREHIKNTEITVDNRSSINVTVSVGIAELDRIRDIDLEAVIKKSDDALYKAKKNGRDRIEGVVVENSSL